MSNEDFFKAVESLIEMGIIELVQDAEGEVRMFLTENGAKYASTQKHSYREIA